MFILRSRRSKRTVVDSKIDSPLQTTRLLVCLVCERHRGSPPEQFLGVCHSFSGISISTCIGLGLAHSRSPLDTTAYTWWRPEWSHREKAQEQDLELFQVPSRCYFCQRDCLRRLHDLLPRSHNDFERCQVSATK